MTTTLDPRFAPATRHEPTSPLRRIVALARAEGRLLARNRATLATGVLMGPLMAGFLALLQLGRATDGPAFATFVVCMLMTWCVLMAVYHNLTAIFVARREERVFKRMSTGEATAWEALVAASTPSAVIVLAQTLLGAGLAFAAFGLPSFTNPLLVLVGIAGAVVVCVALAAVSTKFTSTVESAQYSTMPILMVLIFTSGTNFPLSALPEGLQRAASFTPLNAASDLMSIGLNGSTLLGRSVDGFLASCQAAAFPTAVLAGWVVVTVIAARRTMRFEPRR